MTQERMANMRSTKDLGRGGIMEKMKTFTITLPPTMIEAVDNLAWSSRKTRSALIRDLIEKELKSNGVVNLVNSSTTNFE